MPTPWSNEAELVSQPAASPKPWQETPSTPLKIQQRMPEALSSLDRALVANFSNDPASAVEWLRGKYPTFDIGLVGDQIGMRPKGAPGDYYAVVPKFTLSEIQKNPSEFLNQVSDVAFDLASGVATGSAAGLAAGATSVTGPGALAAGAGAAGATGSALEALRQKIGERLGINKEVNTGQVLTSGAINAATVPLFGAGKAKGAAGKAYDFFADRIAPKAGEIISGVPAETIKSYARHAPEITQMEKEGVLDIAQRTHESIVKPLQQAKMDVGERLGAAVDNAGTAVDVTPAMKPWQDLLEKLNQRYIERPTKEIAEKIGEVQGQIDYYFKPQVQGEVPQAVSARSAFDLKQSMADLGNLGQVRGGTKSSLAGMSPAEKEISIAARDSKTILDKGIEQAISATDNATDSVGVLKGQYRELNNLQDYLDKYFKTPESTYKTLSGIKGQNKKVLYETMQNMDKTYGTDSLKNAEIFDAYKYFGDASFNPLSTKGSTSTGRAVPLAGVMAGLGSLVSNKMGMGYVPGAIAGGVTGAAIGSPAAIANYAKLGRGIRNIQGVLGPRTQIPAQIGANLYNNKESPWTLFGSPINQGGQ